MRMRGWPMLLLVAICACLAVGSGVYLLSGGTDARLAMSVLAIAIGVGLAVLAVTLFSQRNRLDGQVRQVRNEFRLADRGFRDSQNRTEYLATQLLEHRQRSDQVSGAIMAGLNDLKSSHASLAEQMRAPAPPAAPFVAKPPSGFGAFTSPPPPQSLFNAPPPRVAGAPPFSGAAFAPHPSAEAVRATAPVAPLIDRLSTSLEPIVDMFTGKTSHYRLHLGMTKQGGEDVASDVVLHHADRTGLRAGFDLHAARDALGLLRRLRQRDEVLNIFLPIGAATLQAEDAVESLVDLRDEFPDVADGLILEIPHAMLAGLPETGLEGLAQLARHGHGLALANVSVNGIDLPALAKLNVRFVSINSATATGAEGPSPAVLHFAQSARALRVHVIVTNVADRLSVPFISKVSRYASGPAFADPRRVKNDASQGATAGYSAVA